MQVIPSVLNGQRLPIPGESSLPGPAPSSETTLPRYLQLIFKCTSRDPGSRPSFQETLDILQDVLQTEGVAAGGSFTGASPSGSQSPEMCVICFGRECDVALVHVQDNEWVDTFCIVKELPEIWSFISSFVSSSSCIRTGCIDVVAIRVLGYCNSTSSRARYAGGNSPSWRYSVRDLARSQTRACFTKWRKWVTSITILRGYT